MIKQKTAQDRFAEKVRVDDSGCHIWTGAISDTGYGSFNAGKTVDGVKYVGAHKFSYELANGKIPSGLHLDHLCRVRACVNPEHLEVVTPKVNSDRRVDTPAKTGRFKCGHPFEENNIYSAAPTGRRLSRHLICVICSNKRSKDKRRSRGLKRIPPKTRALIYERCQGRCEKCGASMVFASMVLHHRIRKAQGRSDDPSNLLAVTATCHTLGTDSIHLNPENSYKNGWLIHKGGNPAEVPILLYGKMLIYLEPDGSYRKPFNA